jgi:hypothetical protein
MRLIVTWSHHFRIEFSQLSRLFHHVYEISCEPSRLCPQRLMTRVVAQTGVLPTLAGPEEWEA